MEDLSYDDVMKLAAALKPAVYEEEGENPFAIVPEGFKVHALPTRLEEPLRIRQKVEFHDVSSFVAYAAEFGSETAKFFGDRQAEKITAVLDYHRPGSPSFGTHTASLKLKPSREWTVWTQSSGKSMDQTAFAHFLESNQLEITSPPAAEVLEIASTLEAKKGVKFKSGVTLSNGERTFVYEEDLKATAGREGKLIVPERLKLALRPFEGADPFEVEAFFRYRITDGDLKLWYELIRTDKVLETAFEDVLKAIEEKLHVTILHGSI